MLIGCSSVFLQLTYMYQYFGNTLSEETINFRSISYPRDTSLTYKCCCLQEGNTNETDVNIAWKNEFVVPGLCI